MILKDGQRVRHQRWGATGTVRAFDLTGEERASGDVAQAEVVWDGSMVADELELVAANLELDGLCDTHEAPDAVRSLDNES